MTETEASLSRRDLCKWLLAAGVGGTLAASLSGCFRAPGPLPVVPKPPDGPRYRGERPNVVVVLVDDLATGVMGEGSRYPFLNTPHVTRLQREGVGFGNALAPTSVCSPSRASLLTGLYPHTHGVRRNEVGELSPALPNFPSLLKEVGYKTGFVGKWHMQGASAQPRLDFDYWLSFRGQGDYRNPRLNENGREFGRSGYLTDLLTEYAVTYVQTPREVPFCLIVSHKAGHVPFEAARRHENAFAGAQLPEPPNFSETFAGKPAWQRRYKLCGLQRETWEACEGVDIPAELPLEPWNPHDDEMLTHLRTLLAVDEGVGALLEALENMEQLDNTLFIFTSDNGFFLGAHRFQDKRLMYEESLKVPLVLRYPKRVRQGERLPQLVSLLDVAPTVLEYAGLTPPNTMQGASLEPLLNGAAGSWRTHFLYEYFSEHEAGPGVPTMLGVRTERYKYVHYPELPGDIDELYDLESDPFELTNLVASSAHATVLAEMQGALVQQLAETGYPSEVAFAPAPDPFG